MGQRGISKFKVVLDRDDLHFLKGQLTDLGPYQVRRLYEKALRDCSTQGGRLPAPRMMQQLITMWRLLWKWKRLD